MNRMTTFYVAAMLVLSPGVFATTVITSTGSTDPTPTSPSDSSGSTSATTTDSTAATEGAFDSLSSGNQRIARSLMDAQVAPADGGDIWTLDQIAAAKADSGWGNVFREMQSQGLIDAKNLGQVVSSYARSTHTPIPGPSAAGVEAETDETAENDTERKTDSPDRASEERSTTDATATDSSDTASGDATADATADGAATDGNAGAFDRLSPGNQKIARSLMDAQNLPADSKVEPWDLDQIAAAKGQTGWGNVYKQMHSEGLIDAKNLGQVVSQYQHGSTLSSTTAVSGSTAATASTTDLGHEHHGRGAEHVEADNPGIVSGASHGAGHAYGLGADDVVSASPGVTTAAGASINAGTHSVEVEAAGGGSRAASEAAVHAGGSSSVAASSTSVAVDAAEHGGGHAYGRMR